MRILIPILGFGRSGGNRVLSRLADNWILNGHEVVFAAPATSAEPYFPTEARIVWVGQAGERVEAPAGSGESGLGNLLALTRGLGAIHSTFDIVFANHSLTTWPVLFSRVPRKKRFFYIQAYEPEYYALESRWLLWLISRFAYALPFTQIANSKIYNRFFLHPKKIIPFGIDLDIFHPRAYSNRLPGDPLLIGCIGRKEPQKGTAYILDAFQKIYAQDPRYRLKVAFGNLPGGWTHDAMDVVFPDTDEDLASFYRSVDVIVAAGTVQHGAPHYPALEALATGVPLVHTGFLPGTDRNSWLVANRCPEEIVDAVLSISARPQEAELRTYLGIESVKSYVWTHVAGQFIDAFKSQLEQ